jgi:shikimate kinase
MTDEIALPHSVRTARPVNAVALVGFMGAGKTTVGQALALRLGWQFIDLDKLIESREGRKIEHIFQESGESYFRRVEHALLRDCLATFGVRSTVLALGGGAFAQAANCELLASAHMPVVFLDASVEELFRRCEQPDVVRPLRRSLDQFRELYNYRRPSYGNANLHVETGNKEISSITEEIISGVGLIPVSGAE